MSETKVTTGGENDILESYLWDHHRVFVLYLPPRTPKWTPINAVWKRVTKEMNFVRWNPYREDDVAHRASYVLSSFSHGDMWGVYGDCYSEYGLR